MSFFWQGSIAEAPHSGHFTGLSIFFFGLFEFILKTSGLLHKFLIQADLKLF